MVDYYMELKIEQAKGIEEINLALSRLEGVWKRREITNPEKAIKMLSLIIEARKVFSSETARREYDKELENSRHETKHTGADDQRSKSLNKWVKQAEVHFNEKEFDLAKTAIEKAFLYMGTNNDDPEFFSFAADVYRNCKAFDSALNNINKAIILEPNNAYFYLMKSSIYIDMAESNYRYNYKEYVEESKRIIKLALSKAEAEGDNDLCATALGLMAYVYYCLNPQDKKKAGELALEATNVGVDQWENVKKILGYIDVERKAAEEAKKAAKDYKERVEREEKERTEREAEKERERERKNAERQTDVKRRKEFMEFKERVKIKWHRKYVLAWVFFIIGCIAVSVLYTLSREEIIVIFFSLLIFFSGTFFLNYTYRARTRAYDLFEMYDIIFPYPDFDPVWVNVSVGLIIIPGSTYPLTQQSSGAYIFALVILLITLIGCIIISRKIADNTNPIIKDLGRHCSNFVLPSGAWFCWHCNLINDANCYSCQMCGRHND